MVNPIIFSYSLDILTEGLALFFLVLTLYFLKSNNEKRWYLAGISLGLTFASRYPVALQGLVIFGIECIIRKNLKSAIRTLVGAVPVIMIVMLIVFLKDGTFQVALQKDTKISPILSPFYLINSVDIWGFAFLLVPIAFLYNRTYQEKFNYTFIAWFIVSLIFWSANATNHEYRFVFQFTPAVYFLSMLGIENFLYYLKHYMLQSNNSNTNR